MVTIYQILTPVWRSEYPQKGILVRSRESPTKSSELPPTRGLLCCTQIDLFTTVVQEYFPANTSKWRLIQTAQGKGLPKARPQERIKRWTTCSGRWTPPEHSHSEQIRAAKKTVSVLSDWSEGDVLVWMHLICPPWRRDRRPDPVTKLMCFDPFFSNG